MKTEVWWIAERRSRCVRTILIQARTRKEAQAKADNNEGESTDMSYYSIGAAKVIRRDRVTTKG